jgi:hypothetical protein
MNGSENSQRILEKKRRHTERKQRILEGGLRLFERKGVIHRGRLHVLGTRKRMNLRHQRWKQMIKMKHDLWSWYWNCYWDGKWNWIPPEGISAGE